MITEHLLTKAKAYVALVGAVATSLLGIYGPETEAGHWLTVAAAVCTAVATFAIPNAEEGYDWADLVGEDVRPDDETPDDPSIGRH